MKPRKQSLIAETITDGAAKKKDTTLGLKVQSKNNKFAQLLPVLRGLKPGRQAGGTVYCLSRFLCTQRPATSSATPLNHRESLFIGEL